MSNVIPFPKPPKRRRRLLMMMLEADLGEVTPKEAREARKRLTDVVLNALNDEPEQVLYSAQIADVVDVH